MTDKTKFYRYDIRVIDLHACDFYFMSFTDRSFALQAATDSHQNNTVVSVREIETSLDDSELETKTTEIATFGYKSLKRFSSEYHDGPKMTFDELYSIIFDLRSGLKNMQYGFDREDVHYAEDTS